MTALVVGSKGFLGRHLMAALPDAGGVDLPECDVSAPAIETWSGGALGWHLIGAATPSVVWHLAALNGSTQGFYDKPWRVLETQVRGTLNVIDYCNQWRAQEEPTLILFSSSEVFQSPPVFPTPESVPLVIPDAANPRFSYAGGKIAAELLVHHCPLPKCITIRPFNVFGPGQRAGHVIPDLIMRIARAPKGGRVEVKGNPTDRRSFIYVDDFIAGCLAIAKHHETDEKTREVYNVGRNDPITINHLAGTIAREMGRTDVRLDFTGGLPGAVAYRCPDVRKLEALGWSATVDLAEGLRRTIDHLLARREEWPSE
jgi:nucleoside-diphosphate-sugar epimerase